MLKELFKAYKIVGYGLAVKRQMGFAIAFLLIGIVMEVMTKGTMPTGGFYIVLSGMFIYQLIISSDVSTLIQASPYKKKIQCTYPLLATAPWMYFSFAIVAIIHWFFGKDEGAEAMAMQARTLFVIGCFLFVCLIYFGIVYKYFIVSTITMVFVITLPTIALQRSLLNWSLFNNYGLVVAILFAMLIIGTALSYGISLLTYKKDISQTAFKMMLKKG